MGGVGVLVRHTRRAGRRGGGKRAGAGVAGGGGPTQSYVSPVDISGQYDEPPAISHGSPRELLPIRPLRNGQDHLVARSASRRPRGGSSTRGGVSPFRGSSGAAAGDGPRRPGQSGCRGVEIQRVPELLNVVHALMMMRPGHRFVLTGSSARTSREEGSTSWQAARSYARCTGSWSLNRVPRSTLRRPSRSEPSRQFFPPSIRHWRWPRTRPSPSRRKFAPRVWLEMWAALRGSSKSPHSPARRRST